MSMNDKKFVDAIIEMFDDYEDDLFYTEEELINNIWDLIFKYEITTSNHQEHRGK